MAVYRPKDSSNFWYDFSFKGERIRESAGTNSERLARAAEQARRREMERSFAGVPLEDRRRRLQHVSESISKYLAAFEQDHRTRPNSVTFERNRLATVKRILGARLRSELTEATIREYIATREAEGVSGRTINAELRSPGAGHRREMGHAVARRGPSGRERGRGPRARAGRGAAHPRGGGF
ncbi:MAG: hypothetical protein ABSC08_07860 [Bryobacteraceae bacterium]|jgi:hypothetical protein